MKKNIYSTVVASVVMVFAANAQSSSDFLGFGKQFMEPAHVSRVAHLTTSSRAAGDTIWYDDFSDTNNWILGNEIDPNTGYNWIFTDAVTAGLVA